MRKNSNKKYSKCKTVQKTLLEKVPQTIHRDEDLWIQYHLENCKGCRNFALQLNGIQESLKQLPEEKLKPRPEIIERLMNRFNEKTANKYPNYKTGLILNAVIRFLNRRVPIYQAALGMTILFIGFLFLFKKESYRFPVDFQPNLSQSSNRSILDSKPDIDMIKRVQDQNIGLSVQDDSLLFRLFTRSI